MVNSVEVEMQQITEDWRPLSLPSALAFKYMLLTWAVQVSRKSPTQRFKDLLLVLFAILGSIYLLWALAVPSLKLYSVIF